MQSHGHYKELAAIAAKGELNPSEVQELSLHLADCEDCRKLHDEFVELYEPMNETVDSQLEAVVESRREKTRSAVLRRTVLAKPVDALRTVPAEDKGPRLFLPFRAKWFGLGLAGVAAVVLAFSVGMRYGLRTANTAKPPLVAVSAQGPKESPLLGSLDQRPTEKEYQTLKNELGTERQRVAKLTTALDGKDEDLANGENRRAALQQQLEAQAEEIHQSEFLLSAKSEQLRRLESVKEGDANTIVALRYQVETLTGELKDKKENLDRERQLLANGREIRDIIGARNLHIIDVYDTEPDGKTKASFARAFYTEGRSLIFYAYDLPAKRTEEGKFVYAAWGEKNGDKKHIQSLGLLLNDDKGQKRWVLNFSDPKVLAEIDSVFITLEHVGKNADGPTGKRLLTAYLQSEPNHP